MEKKQLILSFGISLGAAAVWYIISLLLRNISFNFHFAIDLIILTFILSFIWMNKPLYDLGIKRIRKKALDSIKLALENTQNTYEWMGFTAFNVIPPDDNQDIIRKKPIDTKYKFYIMDPDAQWSLKKHQELEYQHTFQVLQNRIKTTINEAEKLRKQHYSISYELHNLLPAFRLVFVDNKRVLVGFYLSKKCGIDSWEIEIINNKKSRCLFEWFKLYKERLAEYISQKKLEKVVIKKRFKNPDKTANDILKSLHQEGFLCSKEDIEEIFKEYELIN